MEALGSAAPVPDGSLAAGSVEERADAMATDTSVAAAAAGDAADVDGEAAPFFEDRGRREDLAPGTAPGGCHPTAAATAAVTAAAAAAAAGDRAMPDADADSGSGDDAEEDGHEGHEGHEGDDADDTSSEASSSSSDWMSDLEPTERHNL